MAVTKRNIDAFFEAKRIAVIGMSRDKRDYSRMLMREYSGAGFDIVPVNPAIGEIEGRKCFRSIRDIEPKPERVIMLLPSDKTEQAMIECAEAGIRDVWLHNHVMAGGQNTRAIYQAEKNNMNLITGFCPMMFLPKSALFHKIHGGILKLFGAYPK